MWIERIPGHGAERKCGFLGLPSGSVVRIPPASARDVKDRRSVPGSGRPSGGGNSNPLQDSC